MKEKDTTHAAIGKGEGLRDIPHMLKALSADMTSVLVVEARLFGHTALAMIGLIVVMALLLVSGWLFIGAALTLTLASLQAFSLTGALMIVALAHLVLASLAYWRLRLIIRDLAFLESRASLKTLATLGRSLMGVARS